MRGVAEVLARAFVKEWYGGVISDKERKIVDHNIKLLGWESGLSEDTYYDMNPVNEDEE